MGCKVSIVEGSRAGVPNSSGAGCIRQVRIRLSFGGELWRVPVENKLNLLRHDVFRVRSGSVGHAFHKLQFTWARSEGQGLTSSGTGTKMFVAAVRGCRHTV